MIIHYIICTIEITKSVFIADLFPTTTAWISNQNGLEKGQLKLGHFASGKSKIYVNIDKKNRMIIICLRSAKKNCALIKYLTIAICLRSAQKNN